MAQTIPVRIAAVRELADGIKSYLLACPDGTPLPPFTPGAHIDLSLPNGMVRSYSLVGNLGDPRTYEIAVARDAKSRGGSVLVHDTLKAGDAVAVSAPRNNFPLAEDGGTAVFFAGGIGVTPMLPMVRQLEALGVPWTLHYAARSRAAAAYCEELRAFGDKVQLHFDDERREVMDLPGLIARIDPDAHVYCCGPRPMLDAFQAACSARNPATVHFEHFSASGVPHGLASPIQVHLAKSGLTLHVAPEMSILDRILQEGIDIPYSCMEGTCGECEVKVLDGIPDHRDVVLSKKRRAENKVMMICCSRALTDRLTLDI